MILIFVYIGLTTETHFLTNFLFYSTELLRLALLSETDGHLYLCKKTCTLNKLWMEAKEVICHTVCYLERHQIHSSMTLYSQSILFFQFCLPVVSISRQDNNLYLQHVDMTDYSDITQYQQDAITQILLSPSAIWISSCISTKSSHTDRKRHINTSLGSSLVSKRDNRCPCPSAAVVLEQLGFMQQVKRSYDFEGFSEKEIETHWYPGGSVITNTGASKLCWILNFNSSVDP